MKVFILFISVLLCCRGVAQSNEKLLKELVAKDSSNIPVLFSYPDTIRNAALIAASRPQALIKLDEIQKATSKSFQQAVSDYNQERQQQLWDIIRYTELPGLLIANAGKSKKELKQLLSPYPEETRKNALYFAENNPDVLKKIESIRGDFETKYQAVVNNYPGDVKSAFDRLVANPELIPLLNRDIKSTILLGDLYEKDPALVKRMADSMHTEIAKKDANEYEAWKQGISQDEEMQKELKRASKEYIKDNRYVDDVYANQSYDVNIVYVRPYPYWAGYPYWLAYPYWYPYPWWYHTGFYWNPHGPIIVWGMPSYHFGWWYYQQHNYHQHYPKASNYFEHHNQNWGHPPQGVFNRGGIKPPGVIVRPRK